MKRLAYLLILIICARVACAREYEYTILDVTVLNEYLTGNEVYFVGIFTKNGKEYIDIYDPLTWECIRSMERPLTDDD